MSAWHCVQVSTLARCALWQSVQACWPCCQECGLRILMAGLSVSTSVMAVRSSRVMLWQSLFRQNWSPWMPRASVSWSVLRSVSTPSGLPSVATSV